METRSTTAAIFIMMMMMMMNRWCTLLNDDFKVKVDNFKEKDDVCGVHIMHPDVKEFPRLLKWRADPWNGVPINNTTQQQPCNEQATSRATTWYDDATTAPQTTPRMMMRSNIFSTLPTAITIAVRIQITLMLVAAVAIAIQPKGSLMMILLSADLDFDPPSSL